MSADHNLERYGYQQQLGRSLSSFTSFAVGFSFISITSGIFASYGFALNNSGPRGIWLWILAGVGQILVALIFMQFASRSRSPATPTNGPRDCSIHGSAGASGG